MNTECDRFIDDVRTLLSASLSGTSLGKVLSEHENLVGSGKLLRSRLAYHLSTVTDVERTTMIHAAAAIEMLHGASLLHDDVIDGAFMRRNLPTFWSEKGTSGAILLGDVFLCLAIELICEVEHGQLTGPFIRKAKEMCDAESEQELIHRGDIAEWDTCVSIARRKTGCLFGFIGYAAGWQSPDRDALEDACYDVGTAYQLADDLLDDLGDESLSGKTLGTDAERGKVTAVSAATESGHDPVEVIESLCESAKKRLEHRPAVGRELSTWLDHDLVPVISRFTSSSSV